MSGKRLLDVITFLQVSRTIAGKHIALRKQQLDIHSRTSSLTKGVRAQADSIALAVQAASELARRVDDSPQSGNANQKSEPTTPKQVGIKGKCAAGDVSVEVQKNEPSRPVYGVDTTKTDQRGGNEKHEKEGSLNHKSTETVNWLHPQPDSQTFSPSEDVIKDVFHNPRVARTLLADNDIAARHLNFKFINNAKLPTDISSMGIGRGDDQLIDLPTATTEPLLAKHDVPSSLGSSLVNDVSIHAPEVGFMWCPKSTFAD